MHYYSIKYNFTRITNKLGDYKMAKQYYEEMIKVENVEKKRVKDAYRKNSA